MRAGCFALFVLLVSRDCLVALPHDVTGLSAVGDCGMSWSYSLTIFLCPSACTKLFLLIKSSSCQESNSILGLTICLIKSSFCQDSNRILGLTICLIKSSFCQDSNRILGLTICLIKSSFRQESNSILGSTICLIKCSFCRDLKRFWL